MSHHEKVLFFAISQEGKTKINDYKLELLNRIEEIKNNIKSERTVLIEIVRQFEILLQEYRSLFKDIALKMLGNKYDENELDNCIKHIHENNPLVNNMVIELPNIMLNKVCRKQTIFKAHIKLNIEKTPSINIILARDDISGDGVTVRKNKIIEFSLILDHSDSDVVIKLNSYDRFSDAANKQHIDDCIENIKHYLPKELNTYCVDKFQELLSVIDINQHHMCDTKMSEVFSFHKEV